MISQRRKVKIFFAVFAALAFLALTLIGLYGFYIPKKYASSVGAYAAEYGLDEDLVFAVIRAESNFKRDAKSAAGAIGLMQLMPSTARFAETLCQKEIELYDADDNIRAGCAYLSYLFGKFSEKDTALAAYNAGEGRVRGWLADTEYSADGKNLSYIPFGETRAYVGKVKKFYKYYKIFYF